MNRHKIVSVFFLIVSVVLLYSSCHILPSSIKVTSSSDTIEKYGLLTIYIDLKSTFTNPYDPEGIRVDAVITAPDSSMLILPCFYKSGESGQSNWEARYTPMQTGKHTWYIQVIFRSTGQEGVEDHTDTLVSKQFEVNVTESDNDGFLRLNPGSNYTLLFDSGKPFRGLGLNICWEFEPKWGDEKIYTYDVFLDTLAKYKGNFYRVWMCPWNLPLEWTKVISYTKLTDEYRNWDSTYFHSDGLTLVSEKTEYTEDDLERIIIPSNSNESIIYNLKNIKNFKLKLFYKNSISVDDFTFLYSSDNKTYKPIDKVEFSQTWNTYKDWHRIFIASLGELPEGTHYLKIEFHWKQAEPAYLAGIVIGYDEPASVLDAPGLGKYYQKTADRLDEILDLGKEKGMYMMLAHDYHGIFKPKLDRWGSNDEWRRNPYNAENGGPCETPTDFFTNPEAKRYYKNRLRYMVARWGYSTNLAVWEFWNEVDNVMDWQEVPAEAIVNWHREMAGYLKQLDPYGHLVSTSVVRRKVPGLWDIKSLDFTQHHNYGPTNDMHESILEYTGKFNKPDVVGEFSLGWKGPGKDYPVELYEGEFHRGMWRGLFSPTPIVPLSWWWEWHYEQGHYFHFEPLADFISLMDSSNDSVIRNISVTSNSTKIETLALQANNQLFFWLFNDDKLGRKNLILSIGGIEDGRYLIKKFDTWKGELSKGIETEIVNSQLLLEGIDIAGGTDIALYLQPIE